MFGLCYRLVLDIVIGILKVLLNERKLLKSAVDPTSHNVVESGDFIIVFTFDFSFVANFGGQFVLGEWSVFHIYFGSSYVKC